MADVQRCRPEWDYSEHARYYKYRPNYSVKAIQQMLAVVTNDFGRRLRIADIGAGTGNLTKLMLQPEFEILAVEPNDHMRAEGVRDVSSPNVRWSVGSGEDSGLPSASVHLFAMGSSFNTTDRGATLNEAQRVLCPNGWFACMWNHRNLELPHQRLAEDVIRKFVPEYNHGVRREDQSDILNTHPNFERLQFIEDTVTVRQTLDDYLLAWRSVKNNHWNVAEPSGKALYEAIESEMRRTLPKLMELEYTTRIWMIRKK